MEKFIILGKKTMTMRIKAISFSGSSKCRTAERNDSFYPSSNVVKAADVLLIWEEQQYDVHAYSGCTQPILYSHHDHLELWGSIYIQAQYPKLDYKLKAPAPPVSSLVMLHFPSADVVTVNCIWGYCQHVIRHPLLKGYFCWRIQRTKLDRPFEHSFKYLR